MTKREAKRCANRLCAAWLETRLDLYGIEDAVGIETEQDVTLVAHYMQAVIDDLRAGA